MPTAVSATDRVTFHFDLGHDLDGGADREYWVKGYRGTFPLKAHTRRTRHQAAETNAALAALPGDQLERFTHYSEDVVVSDRFPHYIRVHFQGDGWPLPGLAGMAIHVPQRARLSVRSGESSEDTILSHATLAAYGGPPTATLAMSLDADFLLTPLETAKAILFHHPELASIDSDTAAIVLDTIAHTGGLNDLALAIARQGPATPTGGFATITPCAGMNGSPYTYNESGPWQKAGQTVYHYNLSEETEEAIGEGTLREALSKTKNDLRLHGRKWAVNLGRPATGQAADPLRQELISDTESTQAPTATGYEFTLNNKTPGCGLDVLEPSLSFGDDGVFSLDARNNYLRTLSAYVRFRDDTGNLLTNLKGFKGAWDGLFDHPASGSYFLSMVSAVNNCLGIPLPTDPTKLSFSWPNAATDADLMWGGIGTSDWDGDVVVPGFVATGIFQYGVPVLFLAAGAAIESTSWYKALVADKELMFGLKAAAAFLFLGIDAGYAAMAGVKKALALLANCIAGILVSQGVEKLATWVCTKLLAAEVEDAVPYVGWAVRVANMLTTAAQIAETTVEVLSSPATYTVEVKRKLKLQLTVHPDPTHGQSAKDAIWPVEADHWVAIVQYKDGTNYRQHGPLPVGGHAADPVVTSFTVPGGSQLQVNFGVYSDSDWLAGRWQSAWIDAVLPKGAAQLTIEGSIQENLVPLTEKTQYRYKQKTAWAEESKRYVWHQGDQPAAVVGDLNQSNIGNNLGALVDITVNDKAYMLGYCWTASGQRYPDPSCAETGQSWSFANISTLADPSAGYKFSECGFSDQPFIVYDQFGPAPLFALPADTGGDLDAAKVSADIAQSFAEAKYPITADHGGTLATVTVVIPSAKWTIAVGGTTLYEVRREAGQLQVYSWPQGAFSPNNFYTEPKLVNGVVNYFLRQVVLDRDTPFGVHRSAQKTLGFFEIPHLDAFAVHPSGYVIAASWSKHKLQILKLPASATDDAAARPALLLGGKGARQGLMDGPCALTVSADGRILVLETGNKRIQALDINGNPVHCFNGDTVPGFSAATADSARSLDAGAVDMPLRQAFHNAGVPLSATYRIETGETSYTLSRTETKFRVLAGSGQDLSVEWTITDTKTGAAYQVSREPDASLPVRQDDRVLFRLAAADAAMLAVDAVGADIVAEFRQAGYDLPEPADVRVTGSGYHVDGAFESDLALGKIPDRLREAFAHDRGITLPAVGTVVSSVVVQVVQPGKQWILTDTTTDTSYRVMPDADEPARLSARCWNATTDLHASDTEQVTYLDLASELKGYIYVLGHKGGQAPRQQDYFLDIYTPTGEWLSRTPDGTDPKACHPNAARMIVDQWRTMFTLNYEHYQSGHGTEPSVSEWIPNT